ncbi:hypothetical protein Golomagni_00851 [Golovinomyces magnicellulatus]|nr:hypothetical protein Golomagni_00851 [Golovinomyces magnicellulatus]
MTANYLSRFSRFSQRIPLCLTSIRSFRYASADSKSLLFSWRGFSSTASNSGNWLLPTQHEAKKSRKGRPRVPTGGSSRGTTVMWGDFGLRMCDHHRRIPSSALKIGEDAIKVRLKGMRYRFYKRVCANIGVYTKGNEVRMGKGKGSFDYWASRVAVSKIIFEIKGDIHEQVARDAFRLAGNKMPGKYEFVKKGDPPVVGITALNGVSLEELKRPRRKVPLPMPPLRSGEASGSASTSSRL